MKHNKLTKLILTLTLAIALSFSSFFALAAGVKTAFAEYEATSILTTSEKNNLEFNATAASWLRQTNSTTPDEAFAGSQVGASLTDLKTKIPGITTTDGTNVDLAPEGTEMYVLALFADNALVKETVDEKEQTTYMYYRASSSISLTKNRYYVLSYYVNTNTEAEVQASVKIDGGIDYESDPVNTNGEWQKRHIFIATPTDTSPSITISLCFGSSKSINPTNAVLAEDKISGYVLFDNLNITEITELEFKNHQIKDTTINNSTNTTKRDGDYNKQVMVDLSGDANAVNFSEANVYKHFEDETKISADGHEFDTSSAEYTSAYWYYYTPEDLKTSALNNYYNAYNLKDNSSNPIYFDYSVVTEADVEALGSLNNFEENNKALKMVNNSSVYTLGLISKSTFTIDQFGYYRVSVMVKADSKNKNAEATLMVLSKIPTGNDADGTTFSASHKNTAYSEGVNSTNNWIEIAVYVRGNALRTLTGQIVILTSPNSTIYYDNLKIEKITTETYSNNSSSYALDLSPIAVLQNSNIPNGFFNFAKITDVTSVTYPLTPSNWTSTTKKYANDENKKIVSGIVSTTTTNFASASAALGNAPNPQGVTPDQPINVLGIYAPADALEAAETNTFYYETDNIFSVSVSAVCKITVSVYTVKSVNNSNFTGTMFIKLMSENEVVTDFVKTYDTEGTGEWTEFVFYARTGATSQNFKLRIGIENAQGTVYFKNIRYTALTTKTIDGKSLTDNDQFEKLITEKGAFAAQDAANIRLVDYVTDAGFTHATTALDNGAYRSNNYSVAEVTENEQVVTGTVYIANTSSTVTLVNADSTSTELTPAILERAGARTENVLVIFNAGEYYSTAKSASKFTLTGKEYYRISVWVKTSAGNEEKLTINIAGINAEFNAVGSSDGYTEYVALVKMGSSDQTGLTMSFTLGTKTDRTAGYALISDINYEKIDEETYTTECEAQQNNASENVVVKDLSITQSSSNNSSNNSTTGDEETAENTTLMIFFLVFSSLLLIAALVVALVAMGVKKLPKNQSVVGENQVTINKGNQSKKNRKDGFV